MMPALAPGDLIVYRRAGLELERGGLVVFEHEGGLVVHRIAGLLRDGALRTRGDANESLDASPVSAEDIRGEVLLVLPAGKVVHRLAGFVH
jgi:signal peptidase